MIAKLWHMNADFETELAAPRGKYRRSSFFDQLNRRLAPHLLWLAAPGDALLVESPPSPELSSDAARRGVELVSVGRAADQSYRVFTPWGWTPSAVALGERIGAIIAPPALGTVAASINCGATARRGMGVSFQAQPSFDPSRSDAPPAPVES